MAPSAPFLVLRIDASDTSEELPGADATLDEFENGRLRTMSSSKALNGYPRRRSRTAKCQNITVGTRGLRDFHSHHAAIGEDVLTNDEIRIVGHQEEDRPGGILGYTWPTREVRDGPIGIDILLAHGGAGLVG